MNHFDHGPAEVLVLPWDEQSTLPLLGRIDDADRVVRAAETSVADAVAVLSGKIVERLPEARDWPHQLALDLQGIAHLRLSEWARDHGLHPGSLSRTFERIYGVTPARFRAEAKARRSHRNILAGAERLSEIALDSGFADQAHFSREFRKLTGLAPREFRKGLRVGRIESAFEECQGLIRCSDGLSSGLID